MEKQETWEGLRDQKALDTTKERLEVMAHCVENIYCIADEEDIREQMKTNKEQILRKKKKKSTWFKYKNLGPCIYRFPVEMMYP